MEQSLTKAYTFTLDHLIGRIDYLGELSEKGTDAFPTVLHKEFIAIKKLAEESDAYRIDGIFVHDSYVEDFLKAYYDSYITDELELFMVDFDATAQSFRRNCNQYAFYDEVYYLFEGSDYGYNMANEPVFPESKEAQGI